MAAIIVRALELGWLSLLLSSPMLCILLHGLACWLRDKPRKTSNPR
nr:hypothetical protein [Marinobacterium profundum]